MSKAEFPIRLVLPLLLLICSCQMSSSAVAQMTTTVPDCGAYSSIAASCSIDGAGFISSENEKKQPSQDRDNSPEPANDIDESESGPGDLMAANSLRTDQSTSHFPLTGLDPGTPCVSRIIRFVLLPVNCFLCLREHVGERAPPTLV